MMRFLALLLVLIISPCLQAQLKEFKIDTMPRPEVAVVQANTQFSDDALILVYSAVDGLEFRSSLDKLDKQTYNAAASRYEILVKPNKQIIFVAKAGYIEEKIATLNPNPKEVYYFKVEEKITNVPPPSAGALEIETDPPGADISINGIALLNKTPFKGNLNPGSTQIKLSKKKFSPFDTLITINSNQTTYFKTSLQPEFLYLTIQSLPAGAEISIDGVGVGKTPLNKEIDLSKKSERGIKVLRISLEGYETIEESIAFEPSLKPIELNYDLKKRSVAYTVTSSPAGAEVFVDGAYKGLTPYRGTKEYGAYKIFVKLDGYQQSETKELILNNTSSNQIDFSLISDSTDPSAEITNVENEVSDKKRKQRKPLIFAGFISLVFVLPLFVLLMQ